MGANIFSLVAEYSSIYEMKSVVYSFSFHTRFHLPSSAYKKSSQENCTTHKGNSLCHAPTNFIHKAEDKKNTWNANIISLIRISIYQTSKEHFLIARIVYSNSIITFAYSCRRNGKTECSFATVVAVVNLETK